MADQLIFLKRRRDDMGYYSDYRGRVEFANSEGKTTWLSDDALKKAVETVQYYVEVEASGFRINENGKFYGFRNIMSNLNDLLLREGYFMEGSVEVFGEEPGDIWRLVFHEGVMTEEIAESRWPDGTKVTT